MKKHLPTLAVLAAGVSWGVISLFVRSLYAAGLVPLQISCIRLVTAALCFFPLLALRDPKKLRIRLRDLWMFAGTGIVSVVFFNVLYFYATVHSQASVAVVLLYSSPAFVLLLSALIYKEKITRRKLLSLGLTVLGCALVSGALGGGYRLSAAVLLAGLGSGFFYALYTIFARAALRRYDSMTVTAYTFLLGALASVPMGSVGGIASVLAARPAIAWSCLAIGVVSTALPYVLYTWGLQRLASTRAATLAASEPLVGALLGILAYGEPHGPLKLLGIALILAAMSV
jgi:drug/metabolite transporter (DMT)-like permease